jgi:hypothetical protein
MKSKQQWLQAQDLDGSCSFACFIFLLGLQLPMGVIARENATTNQAGDYKPSVIG